MRRARRKLEVDTFPFLAVLLCAMGSLILLLMVMDRRAKVVAQNKAREQLLAQKAFRDSAQSEAQLADLVLAQSEWRAKKTELEGRLQTEHAELEKQRLAVVDELALVNAKLQGRESAAQSLSKNLMQTHVTLKIGQADLDAKRSELERARAEQQGHRRAREQLTQQLLQLEAALRTVSARKAQEQPVFSLMPYNGKHGSQRRPIYVELTHGAAVFHPGNERVTEADWTGESLRKLIEDRAGPLPKDANQPSFDRTANDGPYVLFLVRPDGITLYYEVLQALRGYRIDFGYELVEPDWRFDFSSVDGLEAQPWRNTAKIEVEPSQVTRPPPKGYLRRQPGIAEGEPTSGLPPPIPFPAGSPVRGGSATRNTPLSAVPGAPGPNGFPNQRDTRGPLSGGIGGSGTGVSGAGSGISGGDTRFPGIPGSPGFANPLDVRGGSGTASAGTGPPGAAAGVPQGDAKFPGGTGDGVAAAPGTRAPVANGTAPPVGSGRDGATLSGPSSEGTTEFGTSGAPGPVGPARAPSGLPGLMFGNPARLGPPSTNAVMAPGALPSNEQSTSGTPGTPGTPATPGQVPSTAGPGASGGPREPRDIGVAPPLAAPGVSTARTPGTSGNDAGVSGGTAGGPSGFGSSNGGDPDSGDPLPMLIPPPNDRNAPRAAPRPPTIGRLLVNRDFIVTIDVVERGAIVTPPGRAIDFAQPGAVEELVTAVRTLVERRQATVRPGEPPYRPLIHFRVVGEGRRNYYLLFPALSELGYPMSRESTE